VGNLLLQISAFTFRTTKSLLLVLRNGQSECEGLIAFLAFEIICGHDKTSLCAPQEIMQKTRNSKAITVPIQHPPRDGFPDCRLFLNTAACFLILKPLGKKMHAHPRSSLMATGNPFFSKQPPESNFCSLYTQPRIV
jgi:hypothetical protein